MIRLLLMMSMVGTFVYFALKLVIVMLSKHLSERAKYNILLVSLITFMIPLTLILPPAETNFSLKPINVRENNISALNSDENDHLLLEESNVEFANIFEISKEISFSMKNIIMIVYGAGMFVFASIYLVHYFKFKTQLKNRIYEISSLELNGIVYKVAWIDEKMSPFVFGILKPIIIIPEYLSNNEKLEFILLHEMTHINRKDTLIKNVTQLIHIVNWFNPFFFLLKQDLLSAMEKSCDEAVVSSMDLDSRKDYGLLILNVVEVTRVSRNTMGLGFSNPSDVKERIENIMSNKKMNRKQKAFVSVSVVVIVGFIFNVTRVMIPVQAGSIDTDNPVVTPINEVVEDESVVSDQNSSEVTEANNVANQTEEETLSNLPSDVPEIIVKDKHNSSSTNNHEVKQMPDENVKKEESQNTSQLLYWPVIGGDVLCGFNCSNNHPGISFTYGDKIKENGSFGDVYAAASGKVIEKSYDSGRLGEYVVVAHDNGDKSLYAHLSSGSSLGVGSRVTKDTVIAHVGMTGKAYYPNVYFEYISKGVKIDPTGSLIKR